MTIRTIPLPTEYDITVDIHLDFRFKLENAYLHLGELDKNLSISNGKFEMLTYRT